MNETIELKQARQMAGEGLPTGKLLAWRLDHIQSYCHRMNEIMNNGHRPIRHEGWLYDPETLVLRHERTDHELDLERATTAAQLLDRILQFARKPDMAVTDMLVLLQVVADARGVGSLQGRFCPSGNNATPVKW
jgi:hypothetical protein